MGYRQILCPIDDSDFSLRGEKVAADLCMITGARLILLHVMDKWYKSSHLATDSRGWDDIHNEWLNDSRRLLEKEDAALRKNGILNIETVLRDGNVVNEIVAIARKKKVDLIVMTSHRYTLIDKIVNGKGSVTERVIKNAPCPVLCVF